MRPLTHASHPQKPISTSLGNSSVTASTPPCYPTHAARLATKCVGVGCGSRNAACSHRAAALHPYGGRNIPLNKISAVVTLQHVWVHTHSGCTHRPTSINTLRGTPATCQHQKLPLPTRRTCAGCSTQMFVVCGTQVPSDMESRFMQRTRLPCKTYHTINP